MSEKTAPSADVPEADGPAAAPDQVAQPARRRALTGGAALATAIALGRESNAQEAAIDEGAVAQADGGAITPETLQRVTVTLQKMDISVQPVGKPFDVTLSARRDTAGNVTIDIPTIRQIIGSSKKSPNFGPKNFPTLIVPPNPGSGDTTSTYSYPKLPKHYPLGGFIDTVYNPLPKEFRPTSGLPVRFIVASKAGTGLRYQGSIDHQGRLQFAALDDFPLDVGRFVTSPTRVTYKRTRRLKVEIKNIQISSGASNSAKWHPKDFKDPRSIHFDFGDYDDAQKGFLNGTFYTTWSDNSDSLEYNLNNQAFKSYALAKISVHDFGRTAKVERLVNLSREPGGESVDPEISYAEGGAAIDPTNEMNLVVAYQQRKSAGNGFVISRSFDGGRTWTRKLIATAKPDDDDEPSDPNIPLGKSDIHLSFDRFGGLWISYLHGQLTSTPAGFTGGPIEVIYSADKGRTFHHVLSQLALEQDEVPADIWPVYVGLDYPYLAIGPDATNLKYETVWMSIGDAIDGDAPNEYQQRIWGLRVKGLGVSEIDMQSLRKYVLPSSHVAGYGSIDVGPRGDVVIALRQVNLKGTYLEQLQNNNRYWVNVLERGLADDAFSQKREFALVAIGDSSYFPATPHNTYLGTGTAMIAIDKSSQHRGRIYAVYCNRPGIYSFATKPYLTWSDDQGLNWSDPIHVSTDRSSATATRANIAVDSKSGVVAVTWFDARDDEHNKEMKRYGAFLDPRQLI